MELFFYMPLIPSISKFLTIKSAITYSFYPIFGHTSAGSGAANEVIVMGTMVISKKTVLVYPLHFQCTPKQ
jgi:hypothetical protein